MTRLPDTVRVECLISAGLALTNVAEQGGDNRGQMVELFLRGVGLPPGSPWCAAFVHHVGYWSQFDPHSSKSVWPLPATGSCCELGEFASRRNVLSKRPWRGDVFLMYTATLGRFAHTGIVLDVRETTSAYLCTTIEGNTNEDGGREGWKSCTKRRIFGKGDGHSFVRWTNLLGTPCDAALAIDAGPPLNSARAA